MFFLDQIVSCSFQWCTCFCCKSNYVQESWMQLFTETVLALNLNFQHIHRIQLTGKPGSLFERALNFWSRNKKQY